jgi:hypothetical protein
MGAFVGEKNFDITVWSLINTLPEDGPIGPKHVGANMRYFNCTF